LLSIHFPFKKVYLLSVSLLVPRFLMHMSKLCVLLISCCFVLMFSHFSFPLLSVLLSSSIFYSISYLLLSSTTYSCFHFECWKKSQFFFSHYITFQSFTLNFTLKFIFSKLWSNPMFRPLSALMSVIALINLLLIKTWSSWFAVLPSAEYHVCLWISLCGNVVLLTLKN
jgi:hypothetical protein